MQIYLYTRKPHISSSLTLNCLAHMSRIANRHPVVHWDPKMGLVSAKCPFHPIYTKGWPQTINNKEKQWDSLKLWNSPKLYSPHCTMGKIDTWGTVSHCTSGGNRWTGIIPVHPLCFLSLLSIPSHCTITGNGQTGIILGSHWLHPLPTVHHTIHHAYRKHLARCLWWFNTLFLSQ